MLWLWYGVELSIVFQQENNNFKLFSDVFIIELPHVEQVANWDCGLACIQMVLSNDLAVQLCQNLSTICPDEYQNKRLVNRKIITKMLHWFYSLIIFLICSTWTIDLCYILSHFSVKIKYYTKTLGVNPSFSQEKFYDSYILKVIFFLLN